MFFGKTPDCVCRVCDVMISSSHTVDQIPGGIHWDRSLSGPPGRTPSCRWSDVASWCSGWSGHAPPETTQDTAKEDLQFFFKQAELLQFCQCFYTLKRQSSEPKNTFWCWTTMQRVFQSFNIFVQMETICSRCSKTVTVCPVSSRISLPRIHKARRAWLKVLWLN